MGNSSLMRRRIRSWFQKTTEPTYPALVRVLDANGAPVDYVDVRAEYLPSGRAIEERRITAQGLCIFGWPASERRIRLTMSGAQGSARLEVGVARLDPERVIEVALSGGALSGGAVSP